MYALRPFNVVHAAHMARLAFGAYSNAKEHEHWRTHDAQGSLVTYLDQGLLEQHFSHVLILRVNALQRFKPLDGTSLRQVLYQGSFACHSMRSYMTHKRLPHSCPAESVILHA